MEHQLQISYAGKPLMQAQKALIMLHGRGADAKSILTLSQLLNIEDYALLAPQATNHTWYPFSFLAPVDENEPLLSSALNIVEQTLNTVLETGIKSEQVYFLGFSQGACLTLEFTARNAKKYGGIVALTGGLIGKQINRENYTGNFEQTPVFIATSNPDFHVPVERVYASSNILREMNASVTEMVYANRGHTISQDEIDLVNRLIF